MLKNIRVRYDPAEDRLIVGIVELRDDAERVIWLMVTRRTYLHWRRALLALVENSAGFPERMDAGLRSVLAAARHRAIATEAGVRKEPLSSAPDVVSPVLVTKAECKAQPDGRYGLRFSLRDATGLVMQVTERTLHGFVLAIERRAREAGWVTGSPAPTARPGQSAAN